MIRFLKLAINAILTAIFIVFIFGFYLQIYYGVHAKWPTASFFICLGVLCWLLVADSILSGEFSRFGFAIRRKYNSSLFLFCISLLCVTGLAGIASCLLYTSD